MRVSLKEIKAALADRGLLVSASNDLPEQATGISDDSRKVSPGDLFIAVRGWNSDGHDFLDAAREKGAAVARGKLRAQSERIKNGVCPCCKRHFTNLERHMHTKHPEFAATEPKP